jgi:hypothetical protein
MKDYSDKSFWLATYGEYFPNPSLQGDINVDIAIIGAGFTGLSTAYNLRKEDASCPSLCWKRKWWDWSQGAMVAFR